jgi:ferric-dicitrate binding protein FerR (iron transport regulator)
MTTPADLDLLLAYLDGDLSAEDTLALERRLKADPSLAQALISLSRDDAVIRLWARAARAADAVWVAADAHTPPVVPRPRRRARLWLAACAAVAAVAAVVVLPALFRDRPDEQATTPEPEGPALAHVEDVQGDVFLLLGQERRRLANGAGVAAGQELLAGDDGSAAIRYADGTRLELGSGTRVRLEAGPSAEGALGKCVVLVEGSLNADVRHQPPGLPLILRTPHAEVTVLGTRFTSSSTAAATRVELQEGQVRVKRTSDNNVVEVPVGHVATVTPLLPKVTPARAPHRRVRPQAVLPAPSATPPFGVAYSPDGALLAALVGGEGGAIVWDAVTGLERARLARSPLALNVLAFTPDGQALALAGRDRQRGSGWVTLWDLRDATERLALRGPREVAGLAVSPDGGMLAVCGNDPPPRKGDARNLWLMAPGGEALPLLGHTEPVQAVAFSPDGRLLASAGRDGTVRLWDVATRQLVATLRGHAGSATVLAFAPDGRRLASGGKDGTARVWDAVTGREVLALFLPRGSVTALAFAPDGRRLVTGGQGFATLWDVTGDEGRELTTFQGHRSGVAFSPDGLTLATCCGDRTVKLWDLRPRWWRGE